MVGRLADKLLNTEILNGFTNGVIIDSIIYWMFGLTFCIIIGIPTLVILVWLKSNWDKAKKRAEKECA